ncbi:putative O-glycosylation ligase, exosortase A system-associated [Erythrobacter sp. F6033]|uniref:putative O-glycosylation ligase, exosortase A system-associated n=1 Tax=Erythrobacter sp. F6033 TaxID=2926401 RepID=UPI001FF0EC28|nr:putative O-glycosylation ligase, exosortase A system-associated [Erythrobacter sp. F6033]MCK0129590.1 putative O-glycosylation ligase, exosortase A system-associated [Erythrobacter sp. F6033]
MLDLVFIAFIFYILLLGLRRPFLWVLLYVYIDIIAPQRIGYTIVTELQISLVAFAAAFGGWLFLDNKDGLRFTLRQGLILALLLYCWWTTGNADFPESAVTKWDWVWKALLFALFLPFTITNRARIEGLALVLVLSIATIVIGTGMKTVLGGGGYENLKFFVNDNSGIYESSTLATVAIALVPLIAWFTRYGTIFRPHWMVTAFAVALIFACLMVPIGTEARTGLVCIAVLAVLMLRYVKHRILFMAAGAALGMAALPFLPQSYYERMSTIAQPGGDESASTRMAVWRWTIEYASRNPTGGGFDAYRGNKFTYEMPVTEEDGSTKTIEYREVTDEGRAYHSAIFELLGEQGYPGLTIWLLLQGLGIWQMEMVRRSWKGKEPEDEAWISPMASCLQMASIIYIVGALFQGIAYQPVMLMIIGIQIGLVNYTKRIESARLALARSTRKLPAEARSSTPVDVDVNGGRAGDAVTA